VFQSSTAQSLASRFLRDQRGSIAIIFALALLPIFGLAGAAVDYSRLSSAQSSLQTATDAAALALSKDAAALSSSDLQSRATAQLKSAVGDPTLTALTVAVTYTESPTTQLSVTASGSVRTDFMALFGVNTVNVSATSQSTWGNTKLRVALVLDTTGSMNDDGKMPALQTAAKALIDQLRSAASHDGDVYVSIVPFSKNINAGPSNYNASWLDWTDWEAAPRVLSSWISNNQSTWELIGPGSSCPFTNSTHGFGCAPDPASTTTTSSIASSGTYAGYICPGTDTGGYNSTLIGVMYNGCYNSVSSGSKVISTGTYASCGSTKNCSCSGSGNGKTCSQAKYTHGWIKNARSTWTGCITDRGSSTSPSGDYDRSTAAPTTNVTASLFPAEQNSYCSPQVMPLSYNWTGMKTAIDGLYPLGATNQPIGLVSGWLSLVGGGPFPAPPAKDSRYQYVEAIILMSDGLNTLNRWYGNGSSTSSSVDQRMYESTTVGTCANIKSANMKIYSVQVNTDHDPTSTLLSNCASSSEKFWMVTTGGALNDVFKQIGTDLSSLRIAR
jgi:Flp pilus assembly protein TadG